MRKTRFVGAVRVTGSGSQSRLPAESSSLTATETYPKVIKEGEKPKTSRTPIFPAEWQNQFGLPVEEHRKLLQVNIFNGYTVFGLSDEQKTRQGVQENQEEVPVDAG